MAPLKKKPRNDESRERVSNKHSDELMIVYHKGPPVLPKVEPDGIIRWDIDKFSELTKRQSRLQIIRGIPWILIARRKPSEKENSTVCDELVVSIYTNMNSQSPLWECEYTYKIFLTNRELANQSERYPNHDCTASLNRNGIGGTRFGSRFFQADKGFINNDKVTVEVWIYLRRFIGMACKPRFDFFSHWDTRSDVALIIEQKLIYVNRQYLALYSEFFQVLFFGHFAETGKREVKIEDVAYKEFIELLNVIYPSRKKITYGSYAYLLNLGDRFQIPYVMELVEDFVINSSRISAKKKQQIALQYRLLKLREILSTNVPGPSDVNAVREMDFSDSEDSRSDVVLNIEGKALHVNKQFISLCSPVFHTTFFGDSANKEEKEFTLEDVVYEEFVDLLYAIYPSSKKITDSSAEYILKLADRYQIACVIERAEEFIIDSENISILTKLRIAEKFKLFRLQDHCFSKLITPRDFKAVKNSSMYKTLSDATKVAIFEQLTERI